MDKLQTLSKIKYFLDGHNNDVKYLVNIEATSKSCFAECIIHPPGQQPIIESIKYTPFTYMKDVKKLGIRLYSGERRDILKYKMQQYGITIKKLKTGNQKRLEQGYCYLITSDKSQEAINSFLTDGGLDPFEKQRDADGKLVRDHNGKYVYPNREYFYSPRPEEQFLISTGIRLYKGFDDYNQVHKLTFDIETTGLRHEITRCFAIGVRDNRGFERVIEVNDNIDDDNAELEVIKEFWKVIIDIKPAIVSGFNSEEFDFHYLLGRAKLLGLDVETYLKSLDGKSYLKRIANSSVKYGNVADKYTATKLYGTSVIDIMHAAKKTAAINSDLKSVKLKYICQFEGIAKPNRTYIKGDDNGIGNMYKKNLIHLTDTNNNYVVLPEKFQELGKNLYRISVLKDQGRYTVEDYKNLRNDYLKTFDGKEFLKWFMEKPQKEGKVIFKEGRELLRQYLLDDLWETEQVDELYNQSSFMLAKMIPTNYQRICTMGTAAVWNLLLTAWSFEHDLAVPIPDTRQDFTGGLARCFKRGYSENLIKIDYASLYPMIQLTWDIFPMFDITGVIKMMLLYLTTTRNIYKKIAISEDLNQEEVTLLEQIDKELFGKIQQGTIVSKDQSKAKVKQLPVKILNNSLFGALGGNIAFNWSDNICAARITCIGRIELRHAISWFNEYNCTPLLCVTDGVNFQIPLKTNIKVTEQGQSIENYEDTPENMWCYGGATGISALIKKFNKEEMRPPYMSVDDDGFSKSCLNLARINYATLTPKKDKKTGETIYKIKLTGNTIKSKAMPEYIEEFIDNGLKYILDGDGKGFVRYYQDYAEKIFYNKIPLKKIANKSKMKTTIKGYLNRGKDKNGKQKAMQAHMELVIREREDIARTIFKERIDEFIDDKENKTINDFTIQEIMNKVSVHMPPEPELDSTIYYYNVGFRKSHGDSKQIKNPETGELMYCSKLVNAKDMVENPELCGEYNVEKYLEAFNTRVVSLLAGFDQEVREKILVMIKRKKVKNEFGKKVEHVELLKNEFTSDQLKLRSYDLDSVEDSMYIEPGEVKFWKNYGYDPKDVWSGIKIPEDNPVYHEFYIHALDYLNDKLKAQNKPLIKSVDDKLQPNDMVLIKDVDNYSVGVFNGTFIKIIRDKVVIPPCEKQLELIEQEKQTNQKIDNLKSDDTVVQSDITIEKAVKEKEQFEKFKQTFHIPMHYTKEQLFVLMPESEAVFGEFIGTMESDDNADYDVDDYVE